ncbi:hypothetical protein L1887_07430 [Cichorium endivia]|nr:hypothetical protein L1887_07430 [Cichorium endivia]
MKELENGCGFFRWLDPPFCPRAREVIYGLKSDFKNSKDEIHELKYKLLKKELETKSKEAKKLRNELECTKKGEYAKVSKEKSTNPSTVI